jgi:hypothetical protein
VSLGAGSGDDLPGVPGEFYGRATRRIATAHCWLEVLAGGGPRIVGFGPAGGENILAETLDVKWDAGHGTFELLGGHRLWFAPETIDCSVPDSTGLELTAIACDGGQAIRMTGAVEAPTGLRKIIEARLDPDAASVWLTHILANEGTRTLELSPWPITQLRPGGQATVQLPAATEEHVVTPNQLLVLWPYASWSDERLSISDGRLTVRAASASRFKIGCLSTTGVVTYVRDGLRFEKRFNPALDRPHADMGCNLEIYTDQGGIELESLGPLVRLAPGQSVTHDERWELSEAGEGPGAPGAAPSLS